MKIQNKYKSIIILFLIILICMVSKSYAASFSAKASNNTLNVGDTTTLTITANDCIGKFTIVSSDSNVVSVGSSSKWIENTSTSVTLTAKKAGTATITVTASDVSDKSGNNAITGSQSVTITVKAPEEVKSSSTTNNTNTNSNTNINNNTGNNSSQSSYVAPVQTKSSDATLKSVKVGGKTYSNPGSTITASNVLANISSITISAETNNSKAKVTGTGTKDLVTGTNIFQLTVTAEDGSKKTYKVRVTKLAEENQTPNVIESSNSNDLKLTSLEVEGINIFPGFKDDVYEYTANFHDLDSLNITAVANNKNAKIEILGNENLVDGDNVINIVVILNDKTVTYKITANKAASLINVEESSQEVIEEKSEINNNSNKSNKKINIGFIGSVKDWWNNGGSLLALFWILWIALGIASIYALLAYKYSKILKEEYGYSFAKEGNNYSLDIEEDKEIGNQELEDWYTNPDNQIETISKSGGKHF